MIQEHSSGVNVFITPWSDYYKFNIHYLQLKEEVGGNFPTGEAELYFPIDNNSLDQIDKLNTGTLIVDNFDNGGKVWSINFFVIHRKYLKNSLTIKFICIENPKFTTNIRRVEYVGVENAIISTFPGTVLIENRNTTNNNTKVYQFSESDANFCTRIAMSYKRDTLIGYSWDGSLKIKDVNYNVNPNSVPQIIGGTDQFQITPFMWNYSRALNYTPTNNWRDNYSSSCLGNVVSLVDYNSSYIVGADYEELLSNYLWNTKLLNSAFFGGYKIVGKVIPTSYELGDTVNFIRIEEDDILNTNPNITVGIVLSNEFFINGDGDELVSPHGFSLEYSSEIALVNRGDWTISYNS